MRSGVEKYWIVNPFSEEINVYWFKDREIEKVRPLSREKEQRRLLFRVWAWRSMSFG